MFKEVTSISIGRLIASIRLYAKSAASFVKPTPDRIVKRTVSYTHLDVYKRQNFNSAKEAMDHGFALITEERKANGIFLKGDLVFNTTIANLDHYKSGVALSDSKMTKATSDEIKIMRTKCMGPEDMISSLSGGNQQKVIFGKWLERQPQVFMMDEPTRGIDAVSYTHLDIGAKDIIDKTKVKKRD